MNKRSLLIGAIAGLATVGTSAVVNTDSAQAMDIKSYNVMEFKSHNGRSGHAFWMKDLNDKGFASDRHFIFKDGPGTFTVNETTGTARFTGTIVNVKADDEIWDIDIDMTEMLGNPKSLKKAGLAPKIAGNTSAENAYAAWDFYDFAGAGDINLTGRGVYEGSTLSLRQKSSSLGIQVGEGANDKTRDLGLSSWFYADGTVKYDKDRSGTVASNEIHTIKNSYGDINVKIDAQPVPEPMSLLGLGAAAVGMVGLKRKQQNAES
ncbi:MAG: PEP-CTERM sorting domain-containing protein [Cyanobacteria bacterium P01_D01_bin.73]